MRLAARRRAEAGASSLTRWGIVVAATFVLAVTAGGRFLLGVVFDQLQQTFSVSHGTLGLIVSLNVLIVGAFQPLVGWLVDRVAVRLVAAVGLACIALGMWVTSQAHNLPMLIFGYGVLVALGLAAVSPVTITPLVTSWFTRQRATALSIVSMGSPLGQLAIVPLLAVLVTSVGWRDAYITVGLLLLAVGAPTVLLLLKDRPRSERQAETLTGCALGSALAARSFWQLAIGFFVCGFTMSWVMTFFFDYAAVSDIPKATAAFGMSFMGGLSIAGTLFNGWWADRDGGALPLAVVYALRGVGFGLLLLAHSQVAVVFLAMAVIGFSWSSTVPLTSALCADIYGRRSLGVIFGLMYAVMPLGSAVGAALSGWLYDATGSYTSSLLINLAVGLIAAVAVSGVRVAPLFDAGVDRLRERESGPLLAD